MSHRGAVLGLSIATAVGILGTALVAPVAIASSLAGAGLVISLLLNHGYARALGESGRPLVRVPFDRLVAAELLFAFALPLAGAGTFSATGVARVEIDPLLAVVIGVLTAVVAICFVSSLIDWYYVLPRRDGLVGKPPCRSPEDPQWQRVTWFWFLHRFIAAVATIGGGYAVAICGGLWLLAHYPKVVAGAGGITVILGVITFFSRDYLRDIAQVWRRLFGPTLALGEHLTAHHDGQFISGFVFNVAIDRIDLLNRNDKMSYLPISCQGDRETKRSLCGSECVRGTSALTGKPPVGGHGGCLADTSVRDREPTLARPRLLVF